MYSYFFNRLGLSISLFLLFGCASRLAIPEEQFSLHSPPAAPDYSQNMYWAALPWKQDSADLTPPGVLPEAQASALADVFFIHPTIFEGGEAWNADLKNTALNTRVDRTTIRHQASAFNQSCRVFAPRYRQMVLGGFYAKSPQHLDYKQQALNLAYEDVKNAFQYFLDHYNEGRPIVIASHSQGSRHAIELIKDFFDGTPLQTQLVAAYILGWPYSVEEFSHLEVCHSPDQTGCLLGWATWKRNSRFKPDQLKFYQNSVVVNPLSWTPEPGFVEPQYHQGFLKGNFKTIKRNFSGVEIRNGVLWVKNPVAPIPAKNYHIADINYFWLDIRNNVAERIQAFSQLPNTRK